MEYVYDILVNGIRKETHDRYEKAVNAYLEFCDQEPLAKVAVEITAPNGFHILCNSYDELEAEGQTYEYSASMKEVYPEDFFDQYALKHSGLDGYVAHKEFNCSEIPTCLPRGLETRGAIPLNVPVHPMFCEKKPDAINPSHYKDVVPGYEYFDMMDYILEGWEGPEAHALGNAYKYLARLGKKDDPAQELGKAIWYLERLKAYLEKGGYHQYRNRSAKG